MDQGDTGDQGKGVSRFALFSSTLAIGGELWEQLVTADAVAEVCSASKDG
jgi:hypothetical protein